MSTKTALVVDDSKSARFALRKYLENHSFKVDTAESAAEAFAFLKTHHPDLIFLDHVMPGLDGFEALNQIKSDPSTVTIPVVICSSNEGDQFVNDARNRGAADVLQKPPSPEQLLKVLDNLQRMSATLKTMAAPKPVVPPAAPSKVASIREPDVAIEQAVMKALRTSMPATPPAPAAPAPPTTPVFNPLTTAGFMASAQVPPSAPTPPAAPAFNPAATGTFSMQPMTAPPPLSTAKIDATAQQLRADIEARMKKMTQDLFVQIAELKAGIAHLESHERSPDEKSAEMRALAASVAEESIQPHVAGLHNSIAGLQPQVANLHAALGNMQPQMGNLQAGLGNLQARIEGLERNVEAHLNEMRSQFEQALQMQAQRIGEVAQAARQAAAEEAHVAAERTVMSAASRIADQLADGILTALGRKQQS